MRYPASKRHEQFLMPEIVQMQILDLELCDSLAEISS